MMRVAVRQAPNLSREEVEGSIALSFSREKRGRFRRVEGTQRERALGTRAEVNAA